LHWIPAADITKGALNQALAHPGDVFRAAVLHSAYALELTVNFLISDLAVVLDSGAKFAGWNAHVSKGIADVSR
jgi:hypothetical protein